MQTALSGDQQGHILLEKGVIQGLTLLFGYHSGSVRTGSDRFYKIISLPEPRTGPKVRFMPWRASGKT